MSFFSTTETQQTAQTDGDRRRRAGGFIWLFQLLFQKRWKDEETFREKKNKRVWDAGVVPLEKRAVLNCGFEIRKPVLKLNGCLTTATND